MNEKRTVNKQLSVFDLFNYHHFENLDKKTIRIMCEYDALNDSKTFKILGKDISEEKENDIITWLEENVSTEHLIYDLDFNGIDFKNNGRSAS